MYKPLTAPGRNTASSIRTITFGVIAALFFQSQAGFAQNTKGDRPIPNQRQVREAKFKTVKKKKRVRTRDISGRRLRTLNSTSASRANSRWQQSDPYSNRKQTKTDKAASPRGRIFDTPPSDRARAWKGDISGHRIRIQSQKSRSARSNVFPQRGPFVNNPSKKPRSSPKVYTRTASGSLPVKRIPSDQQRAWKGNIRGGSVGTPSRSGQYRKVYPQSGRFVNHSSKSGEIQRTYPNQSKIRRASKQQISRGPGKKISVYPRSRSAPFIQRGKRNVYWGKFSKGEKAFTKDITGRPLRTRNFRSTPAGLVSRDTLKFFGRRPGGDRAWRGETGGLGTARRGKQSLRGTGFKSVSGKIKNRSPLPPRAPGIGANGINYSGRFRRGELSPGFTPQGVGFAGNIKARKRAKGGGSVSGKLWNNKQSPIPARTPKGGAGIGDYSGTFRRGELSPGFTKQGADFAGNIKTKRAAKGGGSISGNLWNNQGNPIPVRTPRGGTGIGDYSGTFRRGELSPGFTKQGADFAGNIKTKRAAKGGGSISGKMWNNQGTPIPVRTPRGGTGIGDYSGTFKRGELSPGFTKQGADFSGNIKAKRPAKGGGSISGKLWNNQQSPIPVRTPKGGSGIGNYSGTFKRGELSPGFTKQGADFSGNIKAKRPAKGGGSISGKLWNNQENPIPGRTPSSEARRAAGYPGNYKLFDLKPSMMYQGEEFTGYIKAKKPKKGAGGSISGELWNNNEEPIQVRQPSNAAKGADYAGRIKLSTFRKNYIQNPNASKESIKKQRPDKSTYEVAGLQVKVREGDYKNKPNAAKGALPGVAPSKYAIKASEYARGVKMQWSYKRNPNSAGEALKGRAPDRAYAKIGDYQGNIRMKKYGGSKLHPDAQFAHGFRDNVKEERTILMNIKLIWAKLFRKSETQPDHLKDKERRPRYDKREKGLWYE